MGRLTRVMPLADGRLLPVLAVLAAVPALAACDTVEQLVGKGAQVLTIEPSGGAAYEGRCIPRGAEPVDVSGSGSRTFEFDDGVACRIVQTGAGALTITLTGPRGTSTVTTGRDGETASISRG